MLNYVSARRMDTIWVGSTHLVEFDGIKFKIFLSKDLIEEVKLLTLLRVFRTWINKKTRVVLFYCTLPTRYVKQTVPSGSNCASPGTAQYLVSGPHGSIGFVGRACTIAPGSTQNGT